MEKDIKQKQKLIRLLEPGARPCWVEQIIGGVPEGSRHIDAVRLVGRWYGQRFSIYNVRVRLYVWNTLNLPPMGRSEMQKQYTHLP